MLQLHFSRSQRQAMAPSTASLCFSLTWYVGHTVLLSGVFLFFCQSRNTQPGRPKHAMYDVAVAWYTWGGSLARMSRPPTCALPKERLVCLKYLQGNLLVLAVQGGGGQLGVSPCSFVGCLTHHGQLVEPGGHCACCCQF